MQKDFQEAFFDKKEYGDEKKCKAKQLLSSFMKKRKILSHDVLYVDFSNKKVKKGSTSIFEILG